MCQVSDVIRRANTLTARDVADLSRWQARVRSRHIVEALEADVQMDLLVKLFQLLQRKHTDMADLEMCLEIATNRGDEDQIRLLRDFVSAKGWLR